MVNCLQILHRVIIHRIPTLTGTHVSMKLYYTTAVYFLTPLQKQTVHWNITATRQIPPTAHSQGASRETVPMNHGILPRQVIIFVSIPTKANLLMETKAPMNQSVHISISAKQSSC